MTMKLLVEEQLIKKKKIFVVIEPFSASVNTQNLFDENYDTMVKNLKM